MKASEVLDVLSKAEVGSPEIDLLIGKVLGEVHPDAELTYRVDSESGPSSEWETPGYASAVEMLRNIEPPQKRQQVRKKILSNEAMGYVLPYSREWGVSLKSLPGYGSDQDTWRVFAERGPGAGTYWHVSVRRHGQDPVYEGYSTYQDDEGALALVEAAMRAYNSETEDRSPEAS